MASLLSTDQVTVLYNDVLFRSGTSAEIAGWATLLDAGATVAQVTADFVASSEAVNFIDPLIREYQTVFDRAPDQAGMNFWVAREHAGLSANAIAVDFALSAEFTADYGATINPTSFVRSLYANVLGRTADTSGLNFWVNVLGATPTAATEAAVILGFMNSTEAVADTQTSANAWLTNGANTAEAGTTASVLGTPGFPATFEPVYTVTQSIAGGASTATEGSTIQFQLATGNVPAGTVLAYTITGVTAGEIVGGAGALTGTVTVAANGTASIPVTLTSTAGQGLAGTITATIAVPAGGSIASTLSASVALSETPVTPPGAPLYTVTETIAGGASTATEGSTVQFHLATSNVAAGTSLAYTIAGVTASEIVGGAGALSGNVIVAANGSGTVSVTLTSTAGQGLAGALTATIAVPVGDNAASVLAASATLSETAVTPPPPPANQTLTLTTAVDHLSGGAGNDNFVATASDGGTNTLNIGDTLAGGGGSDTLTISPSILTAATTLADTLWTDISGIGNIAISTGAGVIGITAGPAFEAAFLATGISIAATSTGGAINLDLSTFTGGTTITANSTGGAETLSTGSGATNITAVTGAGAITIVGADLVTVSATTMGAGAQTITSNGAGAVTIAATDTSGTQTIHTANGNSTITGITVSGLEVITVGNGNNVINVSGSNAGAVEHITMGSGGNAVTLTANHIVVDTLTFSAANGGSTTAFATIANAVANDTITFAAAALNNTVTGHVTAVTSIAAGIAAANLTSGYNVFHDSANTYVYEYTGTASTSELVALVGINHSIAGLGGVATVMG